MINIPSAANLTAFLCAALFFTGCAPERKASPKKNIPVKAVQSARSSPEAQKKAYDSGLKYYSEEKYPEARKAWQSAVDYGPSTQLGKKAQEYLQKTEEILKTLKEIEKQ